MLSGMRYTILVLVLLTLACSKKEAPSEAVGAAKTEAHAEAEAEGAAPPTTDADPAKQPAGNYDVRYFSLLVARMKTVCQVKFQPRRSPFSLPYWKFT